MGLGRVREYLLFRMYLEGDTYLLTMNSGKSLNLCGPRFIPTMNCLEEMIPSLILLRR